MTIKKLFTGIISLAAALFAVCAITVCAGAETSGDYEYKILGDGTAEITDYRGHDTKIVIPSVLGGKNVTSIGYKAFASNFDITSVKIPEGVTKIGDEAFSGCLDLGELKLPVSLETIGNYSFAYCTALKEVYIPRGVTKIYEGAFSYNNIQKLWLTSSLEYIGCLAFYKSDIDYIYFAGTYSQYMDINIDHLSNREIDYPKNFYWLNFVIWETEPTVRATNALRLKWRINPSSEGYIIEQKKNGKWVRIKKITDSSIGEYRVSGLKGDTGYDFRICSYSTEENTLCYSGYLYISERTALPPMGGLKLTARSASAVRLKWDKYSGADGYYIEVKSGDEWSTIADIKSGSTTEYRIADLTSSRGYTFAVTAYKKKGDVISTTVRKTITVHTNPSAVKELCVSARAADAVRIDWESNHGADGYIIEMKNGNTWTRVGKQTSNSFKKSKLKAGTAYTFRVKAYKMYGKTALYGATKTISVRTNPTSVTGFKLKKVTKDAARVTWNKNTSADGYIIEMRDIVMVNGIGYHVWRRVGKLTDNSIVEFKKSGLLSGSTYLFRVKAYKMSGKTALYSATKTITVKTDYDYDYDFIW